MAGAKALVESKAIMAKAEGVVFEAGTEVWTAVTGVVAEAEDVL